MQNMPDPSEIEAYLKDVDYPADKTKLAETAREHGADGHIVDFLEKMPDHTYNGPEDVTREIGGDAMDEVKGFTDRI